MSSLTLPSSTSRRPRRDMPQLEAMMIDLLLFLQKQSLECITLRLQYLATAASCNTPQVVHGGPLGISIRKLT